MTQIEEFSRSMQLLKAHKVSDYMHITSNETIEGIQIRDFNLKYKVTLIIDGSSDIGSYKFDWDNVAYLYAGAQKNLRNTWCDNFNN